MVVCAIMRDMDAALVWAKKTTDFALDYLDGQVNPTDSAIVSELEKVLVWMKASWCRRY